MQKVLHETCLEYFRRRLTEGWKCISLEGYNAVLLSPEGIRRELDLRNDVETLRPNAAGDSTQLTQYPATGSNYDKVDEEIPDDHSTYVRASASHEHPTFGLDLYNLPASSGSGDINKITVHHRAYLAGSDGDKGYSKAAIKSGATTDYGTERSSQAGAYTDYSDEWATNPDDSAAWEWADIDALQIGVAAAIDIPYGNARITQVYVEVDYTPAVTEKSSSDAGSGVDAYVSLETGEIKTSSDAGSGAEGTPMQSATLFGGETGSGIEAFVARLLAVFDTGTGAEVSGLLKDLFASEFGQGSDSFVAKIEAPTKGGGMKLWI